MADWAPEFLYIIENKTNLQIEDVFDKEEEFIQTLIKRYNEKSKTQNYRLAKFKKGGDGNNRFMVMEKIDEKIFFMESFYSEDSAKEFLLAEFPHDYIEEGNVAAVRYSRI